MDEVIAWFETSNSSHTLTTTWPPVYTGSDKQLKVDDNLNLLNVMISNHTSIKTRFVSKLHLRINYKSTKSDAVCILIFRL